jgi:SAM-dependent methyltransferase
MPPEDAYADIVQLYDLEHADFQDDVEFLLELAEFGDDPILELGCGTGRVLFPLHRAGYVVTGIDRSEAMLAVAESRQDPEAVARLLRGDMAELDEIQDGPFGLIIASLNSVMHLRSQERQSAMISSAFRALKPKGRLVIDTLNPSLGQLNHLLNTTLLEGTWMLHGETIEKWGHRRAGPESQVIDTLIWYDQTSANGEYRRTRTRFDLRYVHQSELALMLRLSGFGRADWYGSYDLDPWDAESDRIIVVAHKEDS